MNYKAMFILGTGAAMYARLGFCPVRIKITGMTEEDMAEWSLILPAADCIETVDSDGIRTLDSSDGITLVKFEDGPGSLPGSGGTPSELENAQWYDANGIKIDDGVLPNTDGVPCLLEAWGLSFPIVRAVHDGGDNKNTYAQDSSVDFRDAGVEGGQNWVVFNVSNDDCAYVKSVVKPQGQSKYCRIMLAENSAGDATAAADIDDGDILILVPKSEVQYPLTGPGFMT